LGETKDAWEKKEIEKRQEGEFIMFVDHRVKGEPGYIRYFILKDIQPEVKELKGSRAFS